MKSTDDRQIALDRAIQALRDSGAILGSVMATWHPNETRTALLLSGAPKTGRALGRGLAEIQKSAVPAKKLLGKARK